MEPKETIWNSPKSWRLDLYELEKPDGSLVEAGVVRHPGAVGLLPMTSNNEILLISQYRLPLDQTIIEIPAGTREWGEDWLRCAQRELREETGYRAETFNLLGDIWPMAGSSDEVIRLYVATGLLHDPLPQDFDEEIELLPVPFAEAVRMALDGRIQDAKTIAAVLKYHCNAMM